MIGKQEAVAAAKGAARELYSDTTLIDVLLEEVELSDDRKQWLITIGFEVEPRETTDRLLAALKRNQRRYKQFRVDAETGEVAAMKMRQV